MVNGRVLADEVLSFIQVRWHDRLVLQPFTTISEDGVDIYTLVDNDTGQILYSGPDEEPKPGDLEELENQLHAIVPHHEGAEDRGMLLKVDSPCVHLPI